MSESRIFISHKNAVASNAIAKQIASQLAEAGFENVFLDLIKLRAGDDWRQTLLKKLIDIDVLIVLIETKTAGSKWVQREVDMSRGAGTRVLPVLLEAGDEIDQILEDLDIEDIQRQEWSDLELDFTLLTDELVRLSDKTRTQRKQHYEAWKNRIRPQPPLRSLKNIRSFALPELDNVQFHICAGDATEITGYDVLVNTENNHMQMARVHEKNTLSGKIRLKGAQTEAGRIREDSVQIELYNQVRYSSFKVLPVTLKQVVITSAGHPDSVLAQNFRFLLHAAAVGLDSDRLDIMSLPPTANPDIIRNCLKRIQDIDEAEGKILYEKDGTRSRPVTEATPYQPIQSILFPVFGTGEGGNSLFAAIKKIVEGFAGFLPEFDNRLNLTDVGLSIYSEEAAQDAAAVFVDNGFEEIT
jgi:hypothetical protein